MPCLKQISRIKAAEGQGIFRNNNLVLRSIKGHPRPQQSLAPLCFWKPGIAVTSSPGLHASHRVSHREFSSSSVLCEREPKTYSFEDIQALPSQPAKRTLLIDVREPGELQNTGKIPGALSLPITSNPDAFALSEDDFLDRFGFPRPRPRRPSRSSAPPAHSATDVSPYKPTMKHREATAGLNADTSIDSASEGPKSQELGGTEEGQGVDEVVFYCKAGVRSRAAARMARQWQNIEIGDMKGGWDEWSSKGGRAERHQ